MMNFKKWTGNYLAKFAEHINGLAHTGQMQTNDVTSICMSQSHIFELAGLQKPVKDLENLEIGTIKFSDRFDDKARFIFPFKEGSNGRIYYMKFWVESHLWKWHVTPKNEYEEFVG